jgi:predicted transcriptional regulator
MIGKTSVAILRFLQGSKVPVSFRIIKRYLVSYDTMSLYNAIKNLSKNQLINRVGHKKAFLYSVSPKGLDVLFQTEKRIVRRNIAQNIDEYLLKVGDVS